MAMLLPICRGAHVFVIFVIVITKYTPQLALSLLVCKQIQDSTFKYYLYYKLHVAELLNVEL